MEQKKWLHSQPVAGVQPSVIKGVPAFISADTGFGMQKGHDADSEFIAAELKGEDGREFGIMLHMMCMNTEKTANSAYPMALSILSMTDFSNNRYSFREDAFRLPDFSQEMEIMDVETPISGMRGDKNRIEAWADLPDKKGKIHLYFKGQGTPLSVKPGFSCKGHCYPLFRKMTLYSKVWKGILDILSFFSEKGELAIGIITKNSAVTTDGKINGLFSFSPVGFHVHGLLFYRPLYFFSVHTHPVIDSFYGTTGRNLADVALMGDIRNTKSHSVIIFATGETMNQKIIKASILQFCINYKKPGIRTPVM